MGGAMNISAKAVWLAVFLIWVMVIPLGFVTLYSVIEMQAAARSVARNDTRLATLRTIRLARRLDEADLGGSRGEMLSAQRHARLVGLFEARGAVRASAIDLLSLHGVVGATALCTAPAGILKACQIDKNLEACTTDWTATTSCYEQALAKSRGTEADGPATSAMRREMRDARRRGFEFNEISARLRDSAVIENDALVPVAEAYRTVHLPLFKFWFGLPQGVVVACFTSVMAALGAGVSSLIGVWRRRGPEQSPDDLLRSFLFSPVVGGLTGFMVYFVVSAGTAFLVQPAPADPAQLAASNLSAPALASLGLLAGLAAENSILWMRAKAAAVFR
jgi:hypothetical protein